MRIALPFLSWSEELGTYRYAAHKAMSFPVNLGIVAAIAEQAGWEVLLVDAHAERLTPEQLLRKVTAFQPDLVGLTATTPFFHLTRVLAGELKRALPLQVLVGGPHVTILGEEAFDPSFDYVFVGECDTTLGPFLKQYAAGRRIFSLPGLLSREDGGGIVYGGDAGLADDLDSVPFPARHLLRNDRYLMGTPRGRRRYTVVQMSRGCPFSCVFCANNLHGKRYRLRSLGNVIAEIEQVLDRYGVEHIFFSDDVLTLNRSFAMSLCDEIIRRQLRFSFEGSTRANLWDEELAVRLRQAGLVRICFGLETADPVIREIIRKKVPLEEHAAANRLNNRLGIETVNTVMMGLPGETRESIRRTVDYLCRERDLQHVSYNIAVPYPGTEMKRMAEEGRHGLKLVDTDFSHYHRYDSAVMEVNGITPRELVALQRKALLRVYSCPWRIVPVLRRFGLRTVSATFFKTLWNLLAPKERPLRASGGAPEEADPREKTRQP